MLSVDGQYGEILVDGAGSFPPIAKHWLAPFFVGFALMALTQGHIFVTGFSCDTEHHDECRVLAGLGVMMTVCAAVVLAAGIQAFGAPAQRKLEDSKVQSIVARSRKFLYPLVKLSPMILVPPLIQLVQFYILRKTYAEVFVVSGGLYRNVSWTGSWFGYIFGGAGYASVILICMIRAYALADASIDALIDEVLCGGHGDWDGMMANAHELGVEMDELFSLPESGGVWFASVSQGALVAVCGVVMVVATDNDSTSHLFISGCLWFFGGVTYAVVAMYPLALLAMKCKDPAVTARSVLSAARRYPFLYEDEHSGSSPVRNLTKMTEAEKAAHHRFTSYLQTWNLGVELFGLPLTTSFLAGSFVKAVVILPSVYAFLRNNWHRAVS